MDLTRRQIALLVTAIYCTGGLLLLQDYLADPNAAGAHLPLAWHVFPVSVVASLVALLTDSSAPLDPAWYVPVGTATAAFAISLAICAIAMLRVIRGGARHSAEEKGDETEPPENLAG